MANISNLHTAVDYRDVDAVRSLSTEHVGMEDKDEVGATPLISAAGSDQFIIAEVLIDNGADIWAYDRFGITAGRMADVSVTPDDSEEGAARARVMAKMADRGFPFPAPDRATVLQMVKEKNWPPKSSTKAK